jgi:hypothetical protein
VKRILNATLQALRVFEDGLMKGIFGYSIQEITGVLDLSGTGWSSTTDFCEYCNKTVLSIKSRNDVRELTAS